MKIKILLILFFNISCLYGQENILTARDAIIEVQKKISTYTNIKLSFDFTIAGDNEFTNSDFEGILYVEKKKYFLQIKNFIKQINDGNLKYTINDDSKEVMVDSTDENSSHPITFIDSDIGLINDDKNPVSSKMSDFATKNKCGNKVFKINGSA